MENIKVTIIIPSYNKSRFIEETINSVLNQTYKNFEVFIIDDASSDDTHNILNKYKFDSRIKIFINDENKGANFCRNMGINMASGDYIIFLDADDILSQNCLKQRIDFISKNLDLDFAVFPMQSFKAKVGDMDYVWKPIKKNTLERFLSHQLPWQTMQPIWKKYSLIKLNGFDENFNRMQDVELHTRAILEGLKFDVDNSNSPDCFFRVVEDRIKHKEKYVINFYSSAIQFYNKFINKCKEINKHQYLFLELIETSIYLIHYIKSNHLDTSLIKKLENALLDIKVLNYKEKMILRLIFFIYTIPFFYPRGLKYLLRKIVFYFI